MELTVSTGSGHIHLTRGSGTQVHISGHVKSGWGENDQRVRDIAANPPIEQTGNIIRIGARHENLHNISIDYDIEAPADAFLEAGSGSGDIEDNGVGESAKLNTGSGSIHATGLHGGFKVETGSGDIYAEQTGEGDVKAQTGSGRIELKEIHGALHAGTRFWRYQDRRIAEQRLEAGDRLGQCGILARQHRFHARCVYRFRLGPHRS